LLALERCDATVDPPSTVGPTVGWIRVLMSSEEVKAEATSPAVVTLAEKV